MILILDALNMHRFPTVVEDMFQLRARVFAGRLGWEVKITSGKEVDQFDHMNPGYIVGLDDDMNVISCARVLQTTGPHMLSDVFDTILDGEPPLRSPTIWESTRFCVDTQRLKRTDSATTVSKATCELMVGILEYGRSSGITDIITVIDPVMDRVLKRSDNAPHGYVGKTVPMGKVSALAALLDCTKERIERVRAFAGIEGNILLSEEVALQKLTSLDADTKASVSDLKSYCQELLESAATPSDVAAAMALQRILLGKHPADTFTQHNFPEFEQGHHSSHFSPVATTPTVS